MKRVSALAVCLLLVASACSGGDDDDAAPSTSSTTTTSTTIRSTTSTTEAPQEVRLTASCRGIGAPPDEWQITWVDDHELHGIDAAGDDLGCLVAGVDPAVVAWSGDGTRLLAGDRSYVLADGVHEVGEPGERLLAWSRPAGRALIAVTSEGSFKKEILDESTSLYLPFPTDATELQYHPAGTAIVGVVPLGERPNVKLTSNLGNGERWLIDNESATKIHDLAFAKDGALLFFADHADGQHLHRLDLTSNELTSIDELPRSPEIAGLVASQYDEERIAAGRTGCQPPWVRIGGELVDLSGTLARGAVPVAWLADGRLVLRTPDDGCSPSSVGDVYLYDGTSVDLVAQGTDAVAVRTLAPPPPAPPPHIDEAAPA